MNGKNQIWIIPTSLLITVVVWFTSTLSAGSIPFNLVGVLHNIHYVIDLTDIYHNRN
jgi:hypothetical protein